MNSSLENGSTGFEGETERTHREAYGLGNNETLVGVFYGPTREGALQRLRPGSEEYLEALKEALNDLTQSGGFTSIRTVKGQDGHVAIIGIPTEEQRAMAAKNREAFAAMRKQAEEK
ncbi:hypothetical protein COS81_02800 [candidate division WWE3 bacterium CG06_land_8_20_14_3_00_42_16]|uniref:Uncharacterized protein n=3 Tax=Katanobacteria TaxID=422282 RepID=A0A2M7AMZ5_UNCKA|nr:MAG: hypothetical protein AUJ38_02095 [bacterium CG1_02_42_9]PIU68745.1 MAG: hypothetical protein COS81_02800 [candidate division WWE3 bacterium CG06_land_8_20_14_3_00_42_16]PIZ42241.1 MAG: hypothetical protein COY34_03190 [candidate division WWE3 bacterium CG_4_10_14_0_2_um_filter_42_8]PJC68018.1 MAG: hypothetical protein CO015_05525 [candidate division WWE3 bacterium CG_4_8_14_3_um_filter_42_11]